jgi:threonine dehydrogenase-like Zn-dependent dehydrogenase
LIPRTMRAARLHGMRDLKVESLPVPEPGRAQLLVRIDACGVCPTDARKYAIGVSDGHYPLNPGHEWVGRVVATGEAVDGFAIGEQVYGDTYAGYAEFAAIDARPEGWSRGALAIGDLPLKRAVFVEPLADCLHAIHDQGRVRAGDRVAVIGAGSMGLQLVAAAARAEARVVAVEPRADRRALAERFGAEAALERTESVLDWAGGTGPELVILTVASGDLAAESVAACGPGGRVVLFAGFGDEGTALIDLNRLHYEEIALVGSEWIGVPPRQRFERYEQALELLADGRLPLEELVSDESDLDGLAAALEAVREGRSLKTILYPTVQSRR